MGKIVIIGASELQNPLILKAKEMGLETHVFAWQDGSVGEKTADYFYPISIVEKDRILEQCRRIKPDAVASIASDLANITVHYLARELGLTTNSERSILVSTNKYEMRSALKNAGVPTPDFTAVGESDSLDAAKQMGLPLIVKPTDRSGSRSITKIESIEDMESAVARAVSDSFEKKAIIEEFLYGREYSCECISFDGIHHCLAITKKYTTGSPHYIEIGHLQPSGLDEETAEKVKILIFQALDVLEIRYGASHSEFKVDKDGDIHIIEIGSRMGGDCIGSDLVQLSTGFDFVKMVIQVALGEKPCLNRGLHPNAAAVKFICSEQDLQYFGQIKERNPQNIYRYTDMEVKDAEVIDSSSRYGFYIVIADSVGEATTIAALEE